MNPDYLFFLLAWHKKTIPSLNSHLKHILNLPKGLQPTLKKKIKFSPPALKFFCDPEILSSIHAFTIPWWGRGREILQVSPGRLEKYKFFAPPPSLNFRNLSLGSHFPQCVSGVCVACFGWVLRVCSRGSQQRVPRVCALKSDSDETDFKDECSDFLGDEYKGLKYTSNKVSGRSPRWVSRFGVSK